MDLWTAILTIIRRWYISLPVLVLGIIATIAVGTRLQPEYQANASVIFVPPSPPMLDGIRQDFTNPLMIAGGVEPATEAVFRKLTASSLTRQFESFGYSEEYQVFAKERSGILDFVVIGKSEQQALLTTNALISEANNALLDIQTKMDADPAERISVKVIDLPTEAEEQNGNLVRVIATVSALSIAAAAAAAILTESVIRRRRQDTINAAPNLGYTVPGQPPVITSLPDGTTTVSYVGLPAAPATQQVAPRENGSVAADETHELDRLLDDTEPSMAADGELTTERAEPKVVNAGRKRFSQPRATEDDGAPETESDSAGRTSIDTARADGTPTDSSYSPDSVAPNGSAADVKAPAPTAGAGSAAAAKAAATKAASAKATTSASTAAAKRAQSAKADTSAAKTSKATTATTKSAAVKPSASKSASSKDPSAKRSTSEAAGSTQPPTGSGSGGENSTRKQKSSTNVTPPSGAKGSSGRARP